MDIPYQIAVPGKKSNDGKFLDYGIKFGKGDMVGCCLDRDAGTIHYIVNDKFLDVAFHLPEHMMRNANRKQPLFPAICLKNAEVKVNFSPSHRSIAFTESIVSASKVPEGYQWMSFMPRHCLVDNTNDSSVHSNGRNGKMHEDDGSKPLVLIILPSRELAEQVYDQIFQFKKYLTSPSISVGLFVGGGIDRREQLEHLKSGIDIVIGTIGKLTELVKNGKLILNQIRTLILDEADRLLDTGNQEMILNLFGKLKKSGTGTDRLQVLLFSATLHSEEIKKLSSIITDNATFIDLKGANAVPETVDHVIVDVDPYEDKSYLQKEPHVWTDRTYDEETNGEEDFEFQEFVQSFSALLK